MGLRDRAEQDLAVILEDDVGGFGWPITITSPKGDVGDLIGSSNDIAQVIDPDTGVAVSGRSASIALRISSLLAQGLEIPRGIADGQSKAWIVDFKDINGQSYKFKVAKSNPDRGLGIVTCILEPYV